MRITVLSSEDLPCSLIPAVLTLQQRHHYPCSPAPPNRPAGLTNSSKPVPSLHTSGFIYSSLRAPWSFYTLRSFLGNLKGSVSSLTSASTRCPVSATQLWQGNASFVPSQDTSSPEVPTLLPAVPSAKAQLSLYQFSFPFKEFMTRSFHSTLFMFTLTWPSSEGRDRKSVV